MQVNGKRLQWIDTVRALAILCVVLCHATESIYRLDPQHEAVLPMISKVFSFVCFTTGRLGVPLFLMISGALLLHRDYDAEKIRHFWKYNWTHLLVCTLFWFAVYYLFLNFRNESTTLQELALELLLLDKVDLPHVWYMPEILGLYILLPFVAIALKADSSHPRLLLLPMLIFTIYCFGIPLANDISMVFYRTEPLDVQLSFGFSGGVYGLFIVYGYLVRKGSFRKIRTSVIAGAALLSFVLLVFLQVWAVIDGIKFKTWYNNLLLLVTSLGVFELASRFAGTRQNRIIRLISDYSFPVYLTHMLARELMKEPIRSLPIGVFWQMLLLFLGCLGGGLAASAMLRRIPKFGKYILYMK